MNDQETAVATRMVRLLDALYQAALDPVRRDGSIEWLAAQAGIDVSDSGSAGRHAREPSDPLERLLDRLHAVTATDGRRSAQPGCDRPDTSLLRRLLPHVERALALRRQVRGLELGASPLAAAADRLTTGVVLLGPDGRLLFANAEAHRILARADGLGLAPLGLRASSRAANASLQKALERALRTTGPIAEEVSIAVPRAASERPYVVSVAPRLLGPERGAWVLITDLERAAPSARRLRDTFGFTPAEGRLATRLAGGATLAVAARAEGIKVGTARVHLKSIFRKTGCHRQGQLVSLLLRTCPPAEPK
jgi:DNA-binding CsgD family transcriptional regulator